MEATRHNSKEEVIYFSPSINDSEFGYFFGGLNKKKLVLFVSGADEVKYDESTIYHKKEDTARIGGEFQMPVREITYKKNGL